MTTAGAAKHKHLLEKLKPKIVITEEAAQVHASLLPLQLQLNT